jgi:hypothetical protein
MSVVSLNRARSMAAHWRQVPKDASGAVEEGVNPWIVLRCAWERKSETCLAV